MIKRKNKIMALLVAAASITSIVPAMAADSTSRLETKDGTVQHAIAFKDGKYIYEGYRSDDDDQGIYYNGGDKDKFLDDIEDSEIQIDITTSGQSYTRDGSFGEKYAFTEDGDDQYLVDLTDGKIIDDTPEDIFDTAKTKVKSALRKTDRYGEIADLADNANEYNNSQSSYSGYLYAIPGIKFDSDTWYEYVVKPVSTEDNAIQTGGYLYGFTNQRGKYIDISNIANIYAYSTAKGKVVKISEYDDYDSNNQLSASLTKAPEVLAQDKDYIYVKTEVNIFDSNDNAKVPVISGMTVTTTGAAAAKSGDSDTPANTYVSDVNGIATHITHRTYIQKISKAQGDKKSDAYLPKSVASYEITKNEYDCGDADDAYDAIKDATDFSVVNGQLLAIRYDNENVKVTSINLKKDKVKYTLAPNLNEDNTDGTPKSFGTDNKVDVYLTEKDDSDDVDVDDDNDSTPYDIDIDGNIWVVGDGKIYKFKNNEMTKQYTCDSSLNSISVYDENNLITWEEDGDIYTTVSEGKSETPAPTTPSKVGWDQLADGSWNFYDATGTKIVNNWANVGGVWYYLDANGTMVTGWQYVNGAWYYLNPVSDGTKGAMKTGWIYDNGNWYYLNSSGAMATGWQYVNGAWYYLNSVSNGTMGAMKTGWIYDNGNWYYLYSNGAMAANTTIEGYRLSSSGALI